MSDRESAKLKLEASDEVRTASIAAPKAAEAAKSVPPPAAESDTAALLKLLAVGTIVDGKYKIDKVIGKGAMGVVLAATHIHLKEQVALKFLSTAANVQSEDFHSRFRREAQVSAKLKNEHITRVIDVGMWREKYPFMVMDLLVGEDLRVVLRGSPGGRLATGIALDYIVQVCEGLAEAHSHGIVHRDLKPSNLFVTKRHDGSDLIKILDFGISKWSEQSDQIDELTQTGVVLGSPKYMSPEQLFGASEVDSRADVWSLGAIFYEMLSGRPPYDFPTISRLGAAMATGQAPPSLHELVPDLSPTLEAAVMKCFAHERDERTPNVAALAGELLDAIGAPFAGQVRQRVGATLDPKRVGDSLLSSSGANALGAQTYTSLSISSTGNPSISSVPGMPRGSSIPGLPSSQPSLPAPDPTPAPQRKRWAVAGLFLALGAVVAVYYAGKHAGPDAAAPGPTETSTATATGTATSPTPPPSSTTGAGTTTAATTHLEAPPTPEPSATAAPTVTAPPQATVKAPPHWTPPAYHPPVHPPATAKNPTPPPTTPQAPPPAPTATAPKSNPLEDRQ